MAPVAGEVTASGLQHSPPLSLYIHIPWCVRKCPYCDFNSHESRTEIPEAAYVDALIADLEQSVPRIWGRKVHSIFFGGGTPSIFSDEAIDRILSNVRALVPLAHNAEITLEANPGTVDAAYFKGYRAAGINRLSLGIQSFNSDYLGKLGRIHDEQQAIAAAELALQTFDAVNLDVMYALPGQTMQDALADAYRACSLQPAHLSFYHLTLEPNTPFHRTPPALPDDDTSAAMQEAIEEVLAGHGYQHYETSAFAQPGKQCRHNQNYWLFGDYLGIGAGAHSKLSFHDRITRESRHKHPKRYLEHAARGQAVENTWTISTDELPFEFMMNALRLTGGFDTDLFQARTGLPLNIINRQLELAVDKGLLAVTPTHIAPTILGQRFLNELLQLFLD
ncbi:radical SAM family heme chaperone HemW [Methylobacillus caricis]|uniref:radical SAM family heme chaperone HemW n=1 Tax=Methylobacillus caricis TaxID=1971611 RepID=UPI001CFF54A9|nr:radical SAM family heme chaperone HemW [Methylobacillus caricis]MCB5189089.1 radical SAM family heme chaperone HemW [Methylobacillus caricis]